MSSKVLIDGTAYRIAKGKTLVDGTVHTIEKGKTLIDGTAYAIILVRPAKFTVKGGKSVYHNVYVAGRETTATSFSVAPGTEITVRVSGSISTGAWYAYPTLSISWNGKTVASKSGTYLSYSFTAEEGTNYTITFNTYTERGTSSSLTQYTLVYDCADITTSTAEGG